MTFCGQPALAAKETKDSDIVYQEFRVLLSGFSKVKGRGECVGWVLREPTSVLRARITYAFTLPNYMPNNMEVIEPGIEGSYDMKRRGAFFSICSLQPVLICFSSNVYLH